MSHGNQTAFLAIQLASVSHAFKSPLNSSHPIKSGLQYHILIPLFIAPLTLPNNPKNYRQEINFYEKDKRYKEMQINNTQDKTVGNR